jgi:hypothetical protein
MTKKGPKEPHQGMFKKGQSGNPSGRPKAPQYAKEELEKLLPLAIKAVRAVLDGTDETAKAADKMKAADMVFDRNLGRPLQALEMNGETKHIIDMSALTQEQKEAIARIGIDDGH